MILKVQSGSIETGFGRRPGAPAHELNGRPHPPSSSETRRGAFAAAPMAAAVASSMNRIFAFASFTMAAKSWGVEDGASGATATPARSAPRNVAAYSSELNAEIE